MKNKIISYVLLSFVLGGCTYEPPKPFMQKELLSEARGITFVETTPFNCRVLGETSGEDQIRTGNYRRPTMQELTKSAYNDLKNEAANVVGKNKVITMRIISEECEVVTRQGRTEMDCEEAKELGFLHPEGVKVRAQIFDCGDK